MEYFLDEQTGTAYFKLKGSDDIGFIPMTKNGIFDTEDYGVVEHWENPSDEHRVKAMLDITDMESDKEFNSVPSYFRGFLKNRSLDTASVIIIKEGLIPDDVLERINGYDIDDKCENVNVTFSTVVLHDILNNVDDDTNETTKHRIELLYNKVKEFDYFRLTE